MSNMDYYLIEKEGENSKCGMLDLGKCMDSDENSTGENVFPTSTSTELLPPHPDDGKSQGDETRKDGNTNNLGEQKQVIGSSDDQIMSFITASQEEGSSEVRESEDTQIEKDANTCESSDSMFKDIIDMSDGVGLREGSSKPHSVSKSNMALSKDGEKSGPEEALSHLDRTASCTTTTTDEESTKSNLSNDVTIDHKKSKSLDEILDNFCDENSDIVTSQGSSCSDTSNTDDKEFPCVPESQSEHKTQLFEDSQLDAVKNRIDVEADEIHPEEDAQHENEEQEDQIKAADELYAKESIKKVQGIDLKENSLGDRETDDDVGNSMDVEEKLQESKVDHNRENVEELGEMDREGYCQQIEEKEQYIETEEKEQYMEGDIRETEREVVSCEEIVEEREIETEKIDNTEEAEEEIETGKIDKTKEAEENLHENTEEEEENMHENTKEEEENYYENAKEEENLHEYTEEEEENMHENTEEEEENYYENAKEEENLHENTEEEDENLPKNNEEKNLHGNSEEEEENLLKNNEEEKNLHGNSEEEEENLQENTEVEEKNLQEIIEDEDENLHENYESEEENLQENCDKAKENVHENNEKKKENLHEEEEENLRDNTEKENENLHEKSEEEEDSLYGPSEEGDEKLHENSEEELESEGVIVEDKGEGWKEGDNETEVKAMHVPGKSGHSNNKRNLADAEESIRKKSKTFSDDDDLSEDIDDDLEEGDEMMEDTEESVSKDTEDQEPKTSNGSGGTQTEDSTDAHLGYKLKEKEAVNGFEHTEEAETSSMIKETLDRDAEMSADTSEDNASDFKDQDLGKQNEKMGEETSDLKGTEESPVHVQGPKKRVGISEDVTSSTDEEEIFEETSNVAGKVIKGKRETQPKKCYVSSHPLKAEASSAKVATTSDEEQELEDDPYIDFDEESIENISRTIRSFSNEKSGSKKPEKKSFNNSNQKADSSNSSSKRVIMVKTAPNVERVKRKLEEILEKSKGEEDAAIAELQRMKKEKTDILNAITTEMEKLKSMLVKEKQG